MEAWELQRRMAEKAALDESAAGYLLILEHPPTFTTGRRSAGGQFRVSRAELKSRGFDVFDTDRGGLVTYHGPGQLVAYPVVHLGRLGIRSIPDFVHGLEELMIGICGACGVEAGRVEGMPGVFVGPEKIGAIGLHIAGKVVTHGLALNVSTDLRPYEFIEACGLEDRGATSLMKLGVELPLKEAANRAQALFGEIFGTEMVRNDLDEHLKEKEEK